MNSLLEKEGMANKIQMIYIDPPYGIKYASNFQPFINNRSVSEGKDEDLTQEPEMIKAFRDTWELGIHSYLSYMRDRILLAYKLLHFRGSIFVQISDDNIHHIREILDEIFGSNNFISIITFKKTSGFVKTNTLPIVCDYIIQYAKDKAQLKHHQLYTKKKLGEEGTAEYRNVEFPDGTTRRLSEEEYNNPSIIPQGAKIFATIPIVSPGYSNEGSADIELFHGGKNYVLKCGPRRHWTVGVEGTKRLWEMGRLQRKEGLRILISYLDDFPYTPITNIWDDTRGETDMRYVVQTNRSVIERCLLMSTDPGDLILDPTCGSGTTAYVAEKWGRRWITCDTSRVAVTLTRERLMTSTFEYYELEKPVEGITSGLRYNSVAHITRKSLAHGIPPEQEVLYDQPIVDSTKIRITGPFTVEAVPAPYVKPIDDISIVGEVDESITRMGETIRQSDWRDELLKTGIRGKNGQRLGFSYMETLPSSEQTRYLHAIGETKEKEPKRLAISFGPDHAPMEQRQVSRALEESSHLFPRPKMIVFAAFQFDPQASKDIDEAKLPEVTLLKVQMNADLLTEDLKKKRSSNESFWLIGQPEVVVQKLSGVDNGKIQVEVKGFDYYNTRTGKIESGGTSKIAMWMLDTDYDFRSLYSRQVFFPMAGDNEGWNRLAKSLRAEIDEDLIEQYKGTVSLPFESGEAIAIKIIDDRGIESLKVIRM